MNWRKYLSWQQSIYLSEYQPRKNKNKSKMKTLFIIFCNQIFSQHYDVSKTIPLFHLRLWHLKVFTICFNA